MTSAHFIYIPVILMLGLVLGFILGGRSTREAIRLQQQRTDERAQRKLDRAAAKAAQPPP